MSFKILSTYCPPPAIQVKEPYDCEIHYHDSHDRKKRTTEANTTCLSLWSSYLSNLIKKGRKHTGRKLSLHLEVPNSDIFPFITKGIHDGCLEEVIRAMSSSDALHTLDVCIFLLIPIDYYKTLSFLKIDSESMDDFISFLEKHSTPKEMVIWLLAHAICDVKRGPIPKKTFRRIARLKKSKLFILLDWNTLCICDLLLESLFIEHMEYNDTKDPATLEALHVSPDGARFYFEGKEYTANLKDRRILKTHKQIPWSDNVKISKNQDFILSFEEATVSSTCIAITHLSSERRSYLPYHDSLRDFFIIDNLYIITIYPMARCIVYNLECQQLWEDRLGEGEIRHCALSSEAPYLAIFTGDMKVSIWNVASHRKVFEIACEHSVISMSLSAAGKYLALGLNDGSALVYKVGKRRLFRRIQGQGISIRSVILSKHGTELITLDATHRSLLCVWNTMNGRLQRKLEFMSDVIGVRVL